MFSSTRNFFESLDGRQVPLTAGRRFGCDQNWDLGPYPSDLSPSARRAISTLNFTTYRIIDLTSDNDFEHMALLAEGKPNP
jgi:hypothetical protein